MGLKITGLNELQNRLAALCKNAARVSGTTEVPLTELLTPEFLLLNTSFESVAELFQRCGVVVESNDDLENVPEETLNGVVVSHSRFSSWKDMLQAAASQRITRELGFS